MKTLSCMQPYFLPKITYYQLINNSDEFIFLDNLTYSNNKFITSNKIKINNNFYSINLPIINKSMNTRINELIIDKKNFNLNKRKLLKTLNYHSKKNCFHNNEKLCEFIYNAKILEETNSLLSKYILHQNELVFKLLNIKTKVNLASELNFFKLKKDNLVINYCKYLNCNKYLNLIGGKKIYNKQLFLNNKINIKFLKDKNLNHDNNFSIINLFLDFDSFLYEKQLKKNFIIK